MRLDTECDVGDRRQRDADRGIIAAIRNGLIAEHLDTTSSECRTSWTKPAR